MNFHLGDTAVQSARIGITKAGNRRHQGSGLWDSSSRAARMDVVSGKYKSRFIFVANRMYLVAVSPRARGRNFKMEAVKREGEGQPARAWTQCRRRVSRETRRRSARARVGAT